MLDILMKRRCICNTYTYRRHWELSPAPWLSLVVIVAVTVTVCAVYACVCVCSCIFVALKSVQFLCFFRTHRFALAIIAIAYASAPVPAPAPASCPPFNPITIFVLFIMLHRVRPSAFSPLLSLFPPLCIPYSFPSFISVLHLCKFWLLKLKLII